MVRLAGLAEVRMAALGAELGDVPVESWVRFGRLGAELRIEAATFGADLIGLAASSRPGPRHQLRAWYLGFVARAGGPAASRPGRRGRPAPRVGDPARLPVRLAR
jgi:hypothetical protein